MPGKQTRKLQREMSERDQVFAEWSRERQRDKTKRKSTDEVKYSARMKIEAAHEIAAIGDDLDWWGDDE